MVFVPTESALTSQRREHGKQTSKCVPADLERKTRPKAVENNLYSRNSGAGPNHNVRDEDCPQKRNLALQVPTSMGGLEEAQMGSKYSFAAPGEGKGGLATGDRK